MSIADMGASAGTSKSWVASCISSRSGMGSGSGKKLHVSKLGPEDLYPVVRTRFSVVFGTAFFDSTDVGCLANAWSDNELHPTRASGRGARRVGPTTHRASFRPAVDSRPAAAHPNFYRSLSLATSASGKFTLPCLEPYHFCGAIQNILRILIPGPSMMADQGQNTQMVGFYTIE